MHTDTRARAQSVRQLSAWFYSRAADWRAFAAASQSVRSTAYALRVALLENSFDFDNGGSGLSDGGSGSRTRMAPAIECRRRRRAYVVCACVFACVQHAHWQPHRH